MFENILNYYYHLHIQSNELAASRLMWPVLLSPKMPSKLSITASEWCKSKKETKLFSRFASCVG